MSICKQNIGVCLIGISLLAFMLFSCSKEDSKSEIKSEHEIHIQGDLISVVKISHILKTSFVDSIFESPMLRNSFYSPSIISFIKGTMRGFINLRTKKIDTIFGAEGVDEWEIQSYVFHYNSVSSDGEPIVLSGRVTFPNSIDESKPHEINSLSLYAHQFCFDPLWAPYEGMSLLCAKAMFNSAVIEPDYQGMGVDFLVNKISYCNYEYTARQMSDCVKAALQIMDQHNVRMAQKANSTLWGNSEGMAYAMAYLKYYEQQASAEERNAVNLTSAFVGNGPCELDRFIMYGATNNWKCSCWCLFIGQVYALNPSQFDGYLPTDFMSPALIAQKITHNGEEYSYIDGIAYCIPEANYSWPEGVGNRLSDVLAPDMLNSDSTININSPKTQQLLNVISLANNLDGWHPTTQLYWAHSPSDNEMPYDVARQSFRDFSSSTNGVHSSNMHWLDININNSLFSRLLGGGHMTAALLTMLYMSCTDTPADMAQFFDEE